MTQEDEKLLLIDLAARAPYKVKISLEFDEDKLIGTLDAVYPSENRVIVDNLNKAIAAINVRCGGFILNENNVKPYLRPISSMTEEEMDMVEEIMQVYTNRSIIFDFMANGDIAFQKANISIERFGMLIDFLNKQMLDWRGLIQKGLALEAPEGMYK